MKTEVQIMEFNVLLPGHPEVSAWFMAHWSFHRANRGIKPGQHVIPEWEQVKGLVVAVTNDLGERTGMVLFEEINPTEAIVHTALRTFGSRTDYAFTSAIQMARQHGYNRFYYAFPTQSRCAYGLMQRCALLANAVTVRPDWATCDWIFGEFN